MTAGPAAVRDRAYSAWRVLEGVPDPEVPAISLVELGVVREVRSDDQGLEVVLTPTYSGCPATEVIAASVREALEAAGLGPVRLLTRRSPAWTTDWISDEGRRKLRDYGIAPPARLDAEGGAGGAGRAVDVQPLHFIARGVACPRCGAAQTERLSAFGSTACKALYRCLACREPFEYFKPI